MQNEQFSLWALFVCFNDIFGLEFIYTSYLKDFKICYTIELSVWLSAVYTTKAEPIPTSIY